MSARAVVRRPQQEVAAALAAEASCFKTTDISLINDMRHQHEKLDTFHTPGRERVARCAEDTTLSSLDRGWLYSFQERLLGALRVEVRDEASRLRQFFKKAVKEVADELLADVAAAQQGPAHAASKVLGAVWQVVEEIKASKEQLSLSEVLHAIREHSKEPDLTEVLASLDDVKRRIHLSAVGAAVPFPDDECGQQHMLPGCCGCPRVDLSEVLAAIREAGQQRQQQVDLSEVLAAVREVRRPEPVDLSEVLAAVREVGRPEANLSELIALVRALRAELGSAPRLGAAEAGAREAELPPAAAALAALAARSAAEGSLEDPNTDASSVCSELSGAMRLITEALSEQQQQVRLIAETASEQKQQASAHTSRLQYEASGTSSDDREVVTDAAASTDECIGVGSNALWDLILDLPPQPATLPLRERCSVEVASSASTPSSVCQVLRAIGDIPKAAPNAKVDLSSVMAAISEERERILESIGGLKDALARDDRAVLRAISDIPKDASNARVDLSTVMTAICEERERILESIGGLKDALSTDELLAGQRLDALRDEVLRAIRGLPVPAAEAPGLAAAVAEGRDQVLDRICGLQRAVESGGHGVEALLELLRDEAGRLASSRAKLAEALVVVEDRRAQGEQDILQGLEAVRDLRSSVKVDLHPVLRGLEHTEAKMARVCSELMAKLEAQHLEVLAAMQGLNGPLPLLGAELPRRPLSASAGRRPPCAPTAAPRRA